jgi:hypothetical protein
MRFAHSWKRSFNRCFADETIPRSTSIGRSAGLQISLLVYEAESSLSPRARSIVMSSRPQCRHSLRRRILPALGRV